MVELNKARKNGAASFSYKGKTYHKGHTKTGMTIYSKKKHHDKHHTKHHAKHHKKHHKKHNKRRRGGGHENGTVGTESIPKSQTDGSAVVASSTCTLPARDGSGVRDNAALKGCGMLGPCVSGGGKRRTRRRRKTKKRRKTRKKRKSRRRRSRRGKKRGTKRGGSSCTAGNKKKE